MAPTPTVLPARERHVVDRLAYAVTPALAREVTERGGAAAWLETQLQGPGALDPTAALVDSWFPQVRATPQVVHAQAQAGTRSAEQAGEELIARSFALRILSEHQVHETMVDFWSNLLYVPASHSRSYPWRADLELSAIRPRALGTYRDLLGAVIVHPAMTGFLTNDLNRKDAINENLGRELLELHTVGRGSGYTERDVLDCARLLTGFTLDASTVFSARYDPTRHWVGPVRILDFTHPNLSPDGRPALAALLDHLAAHPATARRVALRLCTRFVGDEPPAGVVAHVARAYRTSGGSTAAMLQALVAHRDFRGAVGEKVRTPGDGVVWASRVLGLRPTGVASREAFLHRLVTLAARQGHVPLRWPAPDGWPEATSGFLSGARVLSTWSSHVDLSASTAPGIFDVDVPTKTSQLPSQFPRTLRQLVQHQSRLLLGRPARAAWVAAAAQALDLTPDTSFASAQDVTDEQYQLLRATLLNSPAGLTR